MASQDDEASDISCTVHQTDDGDKDISLGEKSALTATYETRDVTVRSGGHTYTGRSFKLHSKLFSPTEYAVSNEDVRKRSGTIDHFDVTDGALLMRNKNCDWVPPWTVER